MWFRAVPIIAALLLLKASGNVNGRETEEAMELDEVVVTAAKMETSIKEILASVSVIKQEDIKGMQAIRMEEKRDFPRIPI